MILTLGLIMEIITIVLQHKKIIHSFNRLLHCDGAIISVGLTVANSIHSTVFIYLKCTPEKSENIKLL